METNVFINTPYKLSENLQNTLYKLNNCHIFQINTLNKEDVYQSITPYKTDPLYTKIKDFLDNNEETKQTTSVDLFSKLCVLYFNGGIMINKNVAITHMETFAHLCLEYEIVTVKSCVNDSIFDGILIAKKRNGKLQHIIETFLNSPTINVIEYLMTTINYNITCKFLNEQIVSNKSQICYNNKTIAEHYYKNTLLLETYKLTKDPIKDLSKLKVGITTHVPQNLKDFYSNGIKQNCLYLYELLKNIGYDTKLIIDSNKNTSVLDSIDFYKFDYVVIDDVFTNQFDLIFSMGFSIPEGIFISLKNIGVKIIYYMCGNSYLIDTEKILYSQHKNRNINYANDQYFDQVWCIPQMYNQNKYYCEILLKTKCIQIPFIWSPMSIQFVQKMLNLTDDSSLLYKKKDSKIGIFEPNISVMKWALPCLLIAEKTYRTYRNISHVYVTNLNKGADSEINIFNMEQFNNICKGLDLFKDRKISSESRYNTLEFMSKHCDIAISHQWENPLNYLYLDLAWMGWPILHNAHLCKDVGYYYDGFDYEEGSEKLNYILTNHDANVSEYRKKNREVIDMYVPTNKDLQNKYKCLIENLFV